MARAGASPGAWKTSPIAAQTATLTFDRRFSAAEMARLREGLLPEEMEDKWFIVWEDERLRFHRSWTGICVYVARFAEDPHKADGGLTLVEALVNRDSQQYGCKNDVYDGKLLLYLIDALLLGRRAVFPTL